MTERPGENTGANSTQDRDDKNQRIQSFTSRTELVPEAQVSQEPPVLDQTEEGYWNTKSK